MSSLAQEAENEVLEVRDDDHDELLFEASSSPRPLETDVSTRTTTCVNGDEVTTGPEIEREKLGQGRSNESNGRTSEPAVNGSVSMSAKAMLVSRGMSFKEFTGCDAVDTEPASKLPAQASTASIWGGIYSKVKKQTYQKNGRRNSVGHARDPPPRRLSLQPRQRNASDFVERDEAQTDNVSQQCLHRGLRSRSVSSTVALRDVNGGKPTISSRLRSLSSTVRSLTSADTTDAEKAQSPVVPIGNLASALRHDVFPMEECLADPKSAAEFINAVLPGDEWLLALIYSIEEFETLLTKKPIPPIEDQILTAKSILDRFLAPEAARSLRYAALDAMALETRRVVTQFQLPSDAATVIQSISTTLPGTLFDDIYGYVHDTLRDAYDNTFRKTRQFDALVSQWMQRQQDKQLVLNFDQVLGSEWCCTVFWVYLFRSAHHHRLSFMMDVKFKLQRLLLAAQSKSSCSREVVTADATKLFRRLQHELRMVCSRYLTNKVVSFALPTTTPILTRLKTEVCEIVFRWPDSDTLNAETITLAVNKLDEMRTRVHTEFQRTGLERFSGFLASALYRDFIEHPTSATATKCSRLDDLLQLLRVNRIPFHQSPVICPVGPNLIDLIAPNSNDTSLDVDDTPSSFLKGIAVVAAFRGKTGSSSISSPRSATKLLSIRRFEFKELVTSVAESEAARLTVFQAVENFLVPEVSRECISLSELAKLPPVCFNFVVEMENATMFGAVWRFGVCEREEDSGTEGMDEHLSVNNIQGVCVLSRYPLMDGLREYLRQFALSIQEPADLFHNKIDVNEAMQASRIRFTEHCARFSTVEEGGGDTNRTPLPIMDFSLQDLFECLSITHVIRLFSLALQEKKIILVSSSYSVLLSVGQAVKAILSPLVWSHVYVPVLPVGMKGYLHCPMPFIFGLHTSYARHCELPSPSDDLAVVNLDRDSITGGGEVLLPPLRASGLREELTRLYKSRLRIRDDVAFSSRLTTSSPVLFPSLALRHVFYDELRAILGYLETFAFRFECANRVVAVVDTTNQSREWAPNAARFYSAVLQSQAFSSYLAHTP